MLSYKEKSEKVVEGSTSLSHLVYLEGEEPDSL